MRVLNKTPIINQYIQKKLNILFFLTIVDYYESEYNKIGEQPTFHETQPRSTSVPSEPEMFFIPSVRKTAGSVRNIQK